MFHIKTDIRQYKCESAEKVERLIRNWVIRPSDLIYNATEKTWNPIGQHPAFDDIFAGIEQEEANEPDTIVTEAPSEVAAEHEVEPGAELESNGVADDESTNVSPAPSAASEVNGAAHGAASGTPSIVIDAEQATLAADSEEITNVTEAPEGPSGEASADAEVTDDEITDVREDPRRDTDEQDAADSAAPIPPEPSEDVEGLIRDSDEITMMTDKTFEMLSAESDQKKSKSDSSEVESGTSTALADSDDASVDAEAGEDTGDTKAQHSGEPSEESDEHEESTEASGKEDDAAKSSGGGRHGLPEEVFVTDEIPRQDVQQAVLDELGELEEDDEPVDEEDEVTELLDRDADGDDEEGAERKSRWRIVMSDDVDADDEHVEDDEDDEDENDLEVDALEETAEAESVDEDEPFEDDDEEAERPSGKSAPNDDQLDDDLDDQLDDDDLDDMLDEAAELVGLGEGTDPIDIDGGALEPLEDDDEDEGRERAETPVRAVAEPKEFVSEGYKLPLPVDISPSKEDIRLGLKHSRVGKAVKDATFPYPKPKKRDEVATRTYDLDPEEPADHSVLIVAAFLVCLLIITLGAVTLLG